MSDSHFNLAAHCLLLDIVDDAWAEESLNFEGVPRRLAAVLTKECLYHFLHRRIHCFLELQPEDADLFASTEEIEDEQPWSDLAIITKTSALGQPPVVPFQ